MIIEDIAKNNNCDFINVENKGYSYGNNKGIAYCNENYKYDYLIVSNPDVIIKNNELDYDSIKNENCIIAPNIRNLKNKRQNPYWVYDLRIFESMIYFGYKNKNKLILYLGILINKVFRIVFGLRKHALKKIFAAHGSFVVFTYKAIEMLGLDHVYDENMFLFAEEAMLAHKAKKLKINTYYTDKISIIHKEDGSINMSDVNEYSEIGKSVIYYYEQYVKKSVD